MELFSWQGKPEKQTPMTQKVQKLSNGWHIFTLVERIDSFNQASIMQEIQDLCDQGCKTLAIDMSDARFISFPLIRFLWDMATEMKKLGGELALLSPSEKLKRQFSIYASLDDVRIYRSLEELG